MSELRETVAALREKRDELRMEQETHILEAEVRALAQSSALTESWGSLVDPLEYMRDAPGFGFGNSGAAQISQRSDREQGRNRPVFENETELAAIRGAARAVHDYFPVANGAVMENLLSFILGEGLSHKAIEKRGSPTGLAEAVQETVDQFAAANHWLSVRREERFRRNRRDGECFTALFEDDSSVAAVRFIEPEQVTAPADARQIGSYSGCEDSGDWTFGVHTDADDVESVHGYYVQWTDNATDWDYMPANQVLHTKRNVDSRIKRGLSDFFSVQEHLVNIGKLERNVAKGAAILSAIIGIRKYATGVSRSQVQGMIQANAYRRYTETTPLGSATKYAQKITPGSFLDMPSGVDYQQSPLANQGVGEAFVTIEQALLRTVGLKWTMPEYMVSGDASNANYSSTLVAESPFVKYCKRCQRNECVEEELLFWRVLSIACRQGRFRRWGVWSVGELMGLVSMQVTGPIVEARDRPAETTRRKMLSDAGVLSNPTWASEEGLDYQNEITLGATPLIAPVAGVFGPSSTLPADPGETKQDIQVSPALTLNGAQVSAATAIVAAVAAGQIPRDSGLGQLRVMFNLSAEQAETVMGSVGTAKFQPIATEPVPAVEGKAGWLSRMWRMYP